MVEPVYQDDVALMLTLMVLSVLALSDREILAGRAETPESYTAPIAIYCGAASRCLEV